MFAIFSFSSKLPKKGFVPALIANKLANGLCTLVLIRRKVIEVRDIDCIVLVKVNTFLITIIHAPVATVVLVARVAKRFRIFCPSVIMKKLACCFARLLKVGPFGMVFCRRVVGGPTFHRRGQLALSIRIVTKTCFSHGRISALRLPGRYVVVGVRHSHGSVSPAKRAVLPNSRLAVRLSTRSVRGLCRPLIDVTGVCWGVPANGFGHPPNRLGSLSAGAGRPLEKVVVRGCRMFVWGCPSTEQFRKDQVIPCREEGRLSRFTRLASKDQLCIIDPLRNVKKATRPILVRTKGRLSAGQGRACQCTFVRGPFRRPGTLFCWERTRGRQGMDEGN